MDKTMMLVSGNWGPYNTFKMIPINTDCPYIEAIFDPASKILAIISKESKPTYHFVPKIDDNGDQINMKVGKRPNGKDFKEQRVMMDTYQEYYINNLDEVETIVKAFAVNADTYDYKKTIEVTTEELENASAPMPLDKATNLQLVE